MGNIFSWSVNTLKLFMMSNIYCVDTVQEWENRLCHKNTICTQKEVSYNHETSHACSVWKNKQTIKNSEQKIVLFRRYGLKRVTNHSVIKASLVSMQTETQLVSSQ